METNICNCLITPRVGPVVQRLRMHDVATIGVSSITVTEVQCRVAKRARPEENALAAHA